MLARMWGKRNTSTLFIRHKLVQMLWKAIWRAFKKLKIDLPYDLVKAL
jgi:hypothetical protein